MQVPHSQEHLVRVCCYTTPRLTVLYRTVAHQRWQEFSLSYLYQAISFFPWVAPYRTHNFFRWDPWVLCSQLAGSCTDSHPDCRDHLFTSLQYARQSSVPFQAQCPYKVVSGSEISSLGLAVCLQQVCNTLALDMSNRWHQNALKWCRVTCQSLQKLTAPLKWVILRSCCFSCTQQVCVIK